MGFLHDKIQSEYKIDCYYPANGETLNISLPISLVVDVDVDFLKRTIAAGMADPKRPKLMHGTLKLDGENPPQLCTKNEYQKYGIKPFQIDFETSLTISGDDLLQPCEISQLIFEKLTSKMGEKYTISKINETKIRISRVTIEIVKIFQGSSEFIEIIMVWNENDENFGSSLFTYIEGLRRFFQKSDKRMEIAD